MSRTSVLAQCLENRLVLTSYTFLFQQQYSSNELAWDDVNGWQAGDVATHPSGTKLTSFDALDALVALFANSTSYPAMKNITVVGHGGGGQLNQRYAMVANVSLVYPATIDKEQKCAENLFLSFSPPRRMLHPMSTSDTSTAILHRAPTLPLID